MRKGRRFILNYLLAKKDVKTDEFIEYLKKAHGNRAGPSKGR